MPRPPSSTESRTPLPSRTARVGCVPSCRSALPRCEQFTSTCASRNRVGAPGAASRRAGSRRPRDPAVRAKPARFHDVSEEPATLRRSRSGSASMPRVDRLTSSGLDQPGELIHLSIDHVARPFEIGLSAGSCATSTAFRIGARGFLSSCASVARNSSLRRSSSRSATSAACARDVGVEPTYPSSSPKRSAREQVESIQRYSPSWRRKGNSRWNGTAAPSRLHRTPVARASVRVDEEDQSYPCTSTSPTPRKSR